MSRMLFGGGRGAGAWSVLSAALALALPASAHGVDPGARGPSALERAAKPYFDSRDGTSARGGDSRVAHPERAVAARAELRDRLGVEGVLEVDPLTDTPRLIQRLDGAVSPPRAGDPVAIARTWAQRNRAALGLSAAVVDGLELAQRTTATRYGITHLRFRQSHHGIPAFDNGLRISLAADGRILSVSGSPLADPTAAATHPRIGAVAAMRALRADVGGGPAVEVVAGPNGPRRTTRFARGDFARLVLFGTAAGPRLAWHLTYRASSSAYYDAVVDAADGSLLYRQNLTKFASNATVFPNYPGAENDPNPDKAAANVPFQIDFEAQGWIGPNPTELKGPFAHVFTDVNDDDVANPAELVPPSSGSDFQYPFTDFPEPPGGDFDDACEFDPPPPDGWPPPLGTTADCSWDPTDPPSWQVNREQTSTQAFYFTNHFHDHLANPNIGFTDDTDGFGGDGTAEQDDFVVVHANDGADTAGDGGPDGDHINNANMSTPPDGQSPRMQNFLFAFTPGSFFNFRNINGDDDASTVWHEYTHGLSNRLVVNDDGTGALSTPHGGAMGEAWSDWYALDLLHREGTEIDDPNAVGEVDIGIYSDATFTSTRFSPADCPVNVPAPRCPGGISTGVGGFTFGDFGKVFFGPEVHSDGEIWLQTLWDLRTSLIAATGDQIDGSDLAEALVTEAMRLSPPEPSFLDMRNSILAAEQGITGGAARDLVWSVFAGRGMGFFASVADSSDITPIEDFSLPPDPGAPSAAVTGRVTSADTGLPLEGVSVGFGGLSTDPSFPDHLETETGGDGRYRLDVPAGEYGELIFRGAAGFDTVTVEDINLSGGETEVHDAALRRDWAASAGGATIEGSDDTGAPFGCGLAQLIDQSLGAGWSPFNPDSDDPENPHAGPATATITLPQRIDISAFGMDPGNTCGDDPSATTKDFRVETSADGVNFSVAKQGAFAPEDAHRLNIVEPAANATGVVAVRLTLLSPQSAEPGDSGRDFIDFSELEVFGGPPNMLPSGVLSASPTAIAVGETVGFDASFSDPDSAIVGYDWDFDGDGTVDHSTDGPTAAFAYDEPGTFTARVLVKDFRGGAGEAMATVSVGQAAGPSLTLPRRGRRGRLKIEVDCPAPPCEVEGKLRVSAKTAGELGLTKRKLAEFEATVDHAQARVKAKLGRRIRNRAKDAELERIPTKVRADAVDANGARAKAKGTVRIKP